MTIKIVRRSPPTQAGTPLAEHFHPVLDRVYRARSIQSPDELDPSLRGLLGFETLAGIEDAVVVLSGALAQGSRILVVGDFDADGATGSAVAVRGLRLLGAAEVDYLVPNRFDFGYGLTPEIVEVAAAQRPDLIVTVDNGISSVEGVAAARRHGIEVLITDHHLPGGTLPAAVATVNPNAHGCAFPSKALAGVGVMFYVLLALRAELRERGWFRAERPEPNLAHLLDLVALGTVADVVPLDRNNRILVAQGLGRIRARRCQPGILALLEVSGRAPETVSASDLAFALGPRLNAAGRLEDMSRGVACLLSDDYEHARTLARQLDSLNKQRREIEADMRADAMAQVEDLTGLGTNGIPSALCLFEPHWHPGVVGIVAGRVKDRIHRPVIAFAPDGEGNLRGSARSIPGLHIRDVLAAVDTKHPALIERFGGHAMAAGLTLKEEAFESFDLAFATEVEAAVDAVTLEGVILSDGELSPGDFSLLLAKAIRDGGPWGAGFPEPLFDGHFDVLEQRVVGEKHLKVVVSPAGSNRTVRLNGIAFNAVETLAGHELSRVQLAYRLSVNNWRGREAAELLIEQIEPIGAG